MRLAPASSTDGGENIVKDRAFAAAISKRAGADMDRIRLHPLW